MKFNLSEQGKWYPILIVISIFCVVYISNAQQEEDTDERIEKLSPLALELLDRRVEELIANKMDECRLKAYNDAVVYVDSLIIKEVLGERIGADGIPFKPMRPVPPNVILKADSLDVAPLFEEEENQQN